MDIGYQESSSNYRPGEPLRKWTSEEKSTRYDFVLLVMRADAKVPLVKLAKGEGLTKNEQLVLATLNSWCVHDWYEPMVLFLGKLHFNEGVGIHVDKYLVKEDLPE